MTTETPGARDVEFMQNLLMKLAAGPYGMYINSYKKHSEYRWARLNTGDSRLRAAA
jgi:hypothetical protein